MESTKRPESEKLHDDLRGTTDDHVETQETMRSSVDKSAAMGINERTLVRKLDLHLIPLIMGLYLFSFIDR